MDRIRRDKKEKYDDHLLKNNAPRSMPNARNFSDAYMQILGKAKANFRLIHEFFIAIPAGRHHMSHADVQ
ncbi:hypothetical protein [Inquilinus limosus]|uniref:hypothetical protein n=1 Tax=Inquilinus limosus TaxID=171674 RepID=UPI0012DBFFE9|nr:hypothetical protein [Inquilinus limosus]